MKTHINMKTHIKLWPSPDFDRVIVCGSPERAEVIAGFLSDSHALAKNREYHSYLGVFNGQKILVTSHGIGSAGAAICFQELIDAGARSIIRIGTAGGLYDEAAIGDIVLPTAAIRKDGASALMVPVEYPAVPDPDLSGNLHAQLRLKSTPHRRGVILTSDLFYAGPLGDNLKFYQSTAALAVEMECATLFIVGQLRQIRTAALLVLDGNPLKWSEGQYDPDPNRLKHATEKCIEAALVALTEPANPPA